jgi:UDP-N-acetylmuramoylalanine--D-glutamate ligase
MSKPLAVFGAGRSGQAAKHLALSEGLDVVVFDENGQGDASEFSKADLDGYSRCVFSPGFAASHPWRVLAENSALPCLSEIAFAAQYWKGAIIGITGTNGKSTLTALLEKALHGAGHSALAAGNIGYPFSDAALTEANREDAYAVVEISSFQAELAQGLQLDALLWTNFAEDHLDRYHSMPSYFDAKARLFDCLKPNGICVLGPQLTHWIKSLNKEFDVGKVASEDISDIAQLAPESVFHAYPYSENFALAAELWRRLGRPTETLVRAANTFSLAPHRLSVVAKRGNVSFWNDSKATNFHATLAAVKAVGGPIVWIGGGRFKGGDVESFAKELSGQIDAAVVYGEVAQRLSMALAHLVDVIEIEEFFEDAVRRASEIAESISNANVLLSPGFSSFDQFESFDERGKSFSRTVLGLKNALEPS